MVKPVAHDAFKYKFSAREDNDTAEVLIYGDIGESWWGESITAQKFVKDLQAVDADYLDVRINSYGGSVSDGLAIYNALKRHKALVNVHIDGVAVSIASLIAMAGDTVNMAENAMLMIHAPWGGAVGNAKDLREYADVLDKFAEAMVSSYAAKTGKDNADLLALLTDGVDHWYSAAEAVAEGFVDQITEAVAIAAALPRDRFSNLPAAAAAFIRNKEHTMSHKDTQTPAAPATPSDSNTNVVAIEKAAEARAREAIKERNTVLAGRFAGLLGNPKVKDEYDAIMADVTVDMDTAVDRLLAKLGEGYAALTPAGSQAAIGGDEKDKRIAGMTDALLARMGAAKHDMANPWRGMTLGEMCRAALGVAGVDTRGQGIEEFARKALTRVPVYGMQTTSDFPVVLENTLHKLVLSGFAATPQKWQRVAKVGDVTDFRAWARIVPGLIGNLDGVNEHGEYLNKSIPDGTKNTISATRKGNIVQITPEVIVNDDTGYIQNMATGLGQAGGRAIDRATFTLISNNPTLSDGIALFHADHNNLAGSGGAPTVTTLAAARTAMALQTAPGDDAEPLDIMPYVAVSATGIADDIGVVIGAEYDTEVTNKSRVPNKVRNMVQDVVGTPRLSGNAWYIFADPNVAPCIEVVFLNGQREPRLVTEENFRTSGLDFKVELPFGVGAIDYRGGYKNAGAGG